VRKLFNYLGLTLELLGLATIMVVIILFFGKTKMEQLLNMSLTGVAEFYGGYWIMRASHGKKK